MFYSAIHAWYGFPHKPNPLLYGEIQRGKNMPETITKHTIERAQATFSDGHTVYVQERELQPILPAVNDLHLDGEENYTIVGAHWADPTGGIVLLPDRVVDGGEYEDSDYSRIEHIDRAIARLERAKLVLTWAVC